MIVGILALLGLFCFLVCLASAISGVIEDETDKTNDIIIYISLILAFLFIALSFILGNHFDKMSYGENKISATEYITALQDNSEVNGTIRGESYCTRGYFNEELYCCYIVKHSDGGLVTNKIPADKSTIYEVKNNFRVEWYIKTKDWLGMHDEVKSWKIYLPKGSVSDECNIDLK